MPRKTNKNPRVFRRLGNVAGKGVKGVGNIVEFSVKGVWGIGKKVVKRTGKVLNVGTGAVNKTLGATGRIFGKRRSHKRNRR